MTDTGPASTPGATQAARSSTRQRGAGRSTRPAQQQVLDGLGPDPADAGYRGPVVCNVVGISYRQLDYWARTDLVRPSLADARGSGTQRSYSYRDLVRLKVVKSLLDAGVKLQTARKAIEYLREDLGDDWASASLVLNGTNSVLARTGDDLVDLVRHGQGVLNIVPLGHVVDELDARIHELGTVEATPPADGPAVSTRVARSG